MNGYVMLETRRDRTDMEKNRTRHHQFILPYFHIILQTYIMQWQVTKKNTKVQLAGGL